jgi:hypothetical protein
VLNFVGHKSRKLKHEKHLRRVRVEREAAIVALHDQIDSAHQHSRAQQLEYEHAVRRAHAQSDNEWVLHV